MKLLMLLILSFPFISQLFTTDDLDRATIIGTVTDIAGSRVAHYRVVARHGMTGLEEATMGGRLGGYRLGSLVPGWYRVRVEAAGYGMAEAMVEVTAGETKRCDFRVGPGRIEEVVTVRAGGLGGGLDTERTVVGGTIGRAQLQELPSEDRDLLGMLLVLPGVALPGLSDRDLAEGDSGQGYRRTPEESGIFSLYGGTPFSNNLTIEGMDNNDDRAGRERIMPSLVAVEEVQVIASQYSAEYGRASGGRINLRLRGGGERLHGEIFQTMKDARLNANGFMRNADPARGQRLPYFSLNPGFGVGGPIRRERAFFFGAYEMDYVDDWAEVAALVPVERNERFGLPGPNGARLGSRVVDQRGRVQEINGRAEVGLYDRRLRTPRIGETWQSREEWRVGEGHRVSGVLTVGRMSDRRGFAGGRRLAETMRATGRSSYSIGLVDELALGGRWLSSLRVQRSGLRPTDMAADSQAGGSPVVLIDIDDPRRWTDAAAGVALRDGWLVAGSSNAGGLERRETRWQVMETLTGSVGGHTLRVGIDLQRIDSRFRDLTDATGTFWFATAGDFLASRPSRYVRRFGAESRLRNGYRGLFWQDDWRPRTGLLISAGLRHDEETIVRDRNNFGPRLALAIDPSRSGRSVVRLGMGMFWNRAMLRTLDDFKLTSGAVTIDTERPEANGLLERLSFPAGLSIGDPLVATLGRGETAFRRRVERGLRVPESWQSSLGFEREFGRAGSLEVVMTLNRGRHLWRESNANAPVLPPGYASFTEYLLSRDFANGRDPLTGVRPISAGSEADLVRFVRGATNGGTIRENGRTVLIYGLGTTSTSNSAGVLRAAKAAIGPLRPSPLLGQVEELQSRGNSDYAGISVEWRRRVAQRGSLRVGYVASRMTDDGVVNTSSPLVAGDFRRERARSLLDGRHRLAVSGHWTMRGWTFSGILNATSGRPFSIGLGGNDRNLDDVGNDRPNFDGESSRIVWRRPGEAAATGLLAGFSLPAIGSSGNLPRNAGIGPAIHTLSLRLARELPLGDRWRLRLQAESFNPLNSTVFSFGAEYIDFSPARIDNLLTPTRTIRPRTMRLGLRLAF